jgi:hypothetical protein
VLYKQGTDILLRVLCYLMPEADAGQRHFDIAKLTALPKPKVCRNSDCWENKVVNLWGGGQLVDFLASRSIANFVA